MATKRKHGVAPNDPVYRRARYLWKQYRLTPEKFRSLLEEQNYQCKICTDPINEETARLDHCHQTNDRRGLLCHHCNVGLGHFKEDPCILEAAKTYILSNVPD